MRPRANERDRPLCYHFLRSLLDSRTVARLVASRALVYNSFVTGTIADCGLGTRLLVHYPRVKSLATSEASLRLATATVLQFRLETWSAPHVQCRALGALVAFAVVDGFTRKPKSPNCSASCRPTARPATVVSQDAHVINIPIDFGHKYAECDVATARRPAPGAAPRVSMAGVPTVITDLVYMCNVTPLDNHEIKPGKTLRIKISVPNLRLFVGNIPKSKGKEEILEEFGKLTGEKDWRYARPRRARAPPAPRRPAVVANMTLASASRMLTAGLVEVIIYSSPDDKKKNRGFCFLEYESHKAASLAKRRLGTGRIKVWGCDIIVDWADPQEEPDEQTMSKVKVLYVRNLTQEITEEALKEEFERYGNVERVKKIKDYAFVHFEDRDCAVKAMQEIDGKELGGARLEVSLAKPPSDKKKKEEILRARERRMTQMIYGRGGFDWCSCSPVHGALRGRTPQPQPRPPQARGDYDYDYDYYGYGDYRGGYNEPFYRYDEFYFDYAGPPQPSAVRQPPNRAQPQRIVIESVRVVSTAGRSERAMSGAELTPLCVMSRGLGHVGRARAGGGAGPRLGPVVVRAAPLVAAARPAACVATRAPSQVYQVRTRAQEQTRRKRKLDGGQQIAGGERESKRRLGAAAAAARGWGSAGVGSMGSMGSEGAAAS
ncbi:Heterogeneous nuclear ribonucleoprotein Q [Danaus plexippus plexippus]|uniref:Heterogeneous nuclear ribonucleoprotein Q n=1 Tax=Danaus plexippus plexippus TaxID=278856 RepID=A0A212F165_DANPL|nr:Heterogeneous nuclear ribonucleoprotein Q [Danaus plexippus plexippus]